MSGRVRRVKLHVFKPDQAINMSEMSQKKCKQCHALKSPRDFKLVKKDGIERLGQSCMACQEKDAQRKKEQRAKKRHRESEELDVDAETMPMKTLEEFLEELDTAAEDDHIHEKIKVDTTNHISMDLDRKKRSESLAQMIGGCHKLRWMCVILFLSLFCELMGGC